LTRVGWKGLGQALAIGLAFPVVAAGIFIHHVWESDPSRQELLVQDNLRAVLASGVAEIELAAIAPFEWDRACMVSAYMSGEGLQKAIGIELAGNSSISWRNNEGYWTLAFIAGDRMTPVRIPVMGLGHRSLPAGKAVECVPRQSGVLTYKTNYRAGWAPRDFSIAQASLSPRGVVR
jgi:hypothetical protein